MRCPYCRHPEQRVLDSRPVSEADAIRRRRECAGCGRRFTTHERFERPARFVVKRDGGRVEFDPEKLLRSVAVACRKRPVTAETLRQAVERVERDVYGECETEVSTRALGEAVLRELRSIDVVAFVRFASVYRDFEDADAFRTLLDEHESAPRAEWPRLPL